MVITPYSLPYEVYHPADDVFAQGGDVRLAIDMAQPADAAVGELIAQAITAFTQLASTGALSGRAIPPWGSNVADESRASTVSPLQVAWDLRGCRIDDTAILIPVHFLLDVHAAHAIRRVTVTRPGARLERLRTDPKTVSPYPAVYAGVPFPVVFGENIMDSPTVSIRFQSAPTEEQEENIGASLLTWAAATAMGAYALPPFPPAESGAAVDPDLVIVGDQLDWELLKYRAHPDSLRGLVNVLIAIGHDVLPVEHVTIE